MESGFGPAVKGKKHIPFVFSLEVNGCTFIHFPFEAGRPPGCFLLIYEIGISQVCIIV